MRPVIALGSLVGRSEMLLLTLDSSTGSDWQSVADMKLRARAFVGPEAWQR